MRPKGHIPRTWLSKEDREPYGASTRPGAGSMAKHSKVTVSNLESVACNLCGGFSHESVYRMPDQKYHPDEWFQVVQCRDCGLGFVNPRPTQSAIDRYYPRDFFDYFDEDIRFHQVRYAREADFLPKIPQGSNPSRLLDVGCANGAFPRFVRNIGWEVEGVEIAASSTPIDDFPVHRCIFPDIPIHAPRYDVVTAWAVLEHVHDPMSYFEKAAQVLKRGGSFIFQVTNFESISSKFLFREDVPRHLHFFSHRTVQGYLEKNGFTLERQACDDSIYEMAPLHWLRYYLRRASGLPPLRWDQLPESCLNYCNRLGIGHGVRGRLQYALTHPFTAFDRFLMPAFAKWQQLMDTYGMTTYIARRC